MAATLERIRFLLVDDNLQMTRMVKTMLRGLGAHHIFEAHSTAEAMAHLRTGGIDIVILDYHLGPADDGFSLVRQVRTSPASPVPYIPIIMLTAHSDRARVEAARDAGVTEFCAKPLRADHLLKKIAAVIDRPRPFLRADDYFGPDRRRMDNPKLVRSERRAGRQTGS